MKCFVILILSIMNSVTSIACEKEIIKFVSENETIIFYTDDFLEIDTVNSLVTLSEKGLKKVNEIENEKGLFYLKSLNEEWISIDIFEAREAKRGDAPAIITLKNKLIFYSKNQLVIQGSIWFLIASNANIHIKE